MSLLTEMMGQFGFVERRKDGRCLAQGLEVWYGAGAQQKELPIRDISATGIFVLTGERLQPGICAYLTLARNRGVIGKSCSGVRLRVRAVRQDENGLALSFEPHSPDAVSWLDLMSMAAPVAGAAGAVERFRIAKALSFLASIAAPVQSEIAELMHQTMSQKRRERLIVMILEAEEQLEQWKRPVRDRVCPDLVRQILLFGSNAEDNRTRSFWQQLLITSCLSIHREDESLQLANILSQLLPIDLELFCTACELAMAGSWSDSGKIYCSARELRAIAQTPSLIMIEQHLRHLYDLGLLEQTVKPLKGELIGQGNLTATPLGVELYARCCEFQSACT